MSSKLCSINSYLVYYDYTYIHIHICTVYLLVEAVVLTAYGFSIDCLLETQFLQIMFATLAKIVHHVELHRFRRFLQNLCTSCGCTIVDDSPRTCTDFVDFFKMCVRQGAAHISTILAKSMHCMALHRFRRFLLANPVDDMELHRLLRFLQNLRTWQRTDFNDSFESSYDMDLHRFQTLLQNLNATWGCTDSFDNS